MTISLSDLKAKRAVVCPWHVLYSTECPGCLRAAEEEGRRWAAETLRRIRRALAKITT